MWASCWECWQSAAFPRCRDCLHITHILLPTRRLQGGQLLTRHFDAILEGPVPHHLPLDLVHRVDHGRVVPPPERLPDFDQLHAQHVARQIHCHLAGDGERLGARFGPQPLGGDAPAARHDFLDPIDAGRGLGGVAGCLLALADLVRQRLARELERMCSAMKRNTSSGMVSSRWSCSAFLRRIAIRCSRSGCPMSATNPHSKREISRSSRPGISFGGRSEVSTICLCPSNSALKVWKNSSCVISLPSRKWTSSTRKRSTPARCPSSGAATATTWINSMTSLMNCSAPK